MGEMVNFMRNGGMGARPHKHYTTRRANKTIDHGRSPHINIKKKKSRAQPCRFMGCGASPHE